MAVIIPYVAYEEGQALREQKRRHNALARLNALRERIIARNGEMPFEEADAFAREVTRSALARLIERGEVTFEEKGS